jgi:hypothetical protein
MRRYIAVLLLVLFLMAVYSLATLRVNENKRFLQVGCSPESVSKEYSPHRNAVPGKNTGTPDGDVPVPASRGGGSVGYLQNDDQEVIFTTAGSTFEPVLTLRPHAKVTWTFGDGAVSTSPHPRKKFSNASIRYNRLRIDPWSALIRVNLGYDGADGGSGSIEHNPPQYVIKVENMHLMAPYLRQWCSSHNHISSLVFNNFILLESIDCYRAGGLISIGLRNTPSLKRVCFEACGLNYIDVSESPNLEDLRAAYNTSHVIKFGATGAHIWHFCIRDNPQIDQEMPISRFANWSELYISNSNQSGQLKNLGHMLTAVDIKSNKYTSANFSDNLRLEAINCSDNRLGSLNLRGCSALKELLCTGNELKTLDISSCKDLTYLDAHENELSSSEVDNILANLVKNNCRGGTCNLTVNGPPSRTGYAYRKILLARGWKVSISSTLSNAESRFKDMLYSIYQNWKFYRKD